MVLGCSSASTRFLDGGVTCSSATLLVPGSVLEGTGVLNASALFSAAVGAFAAAAARRLVVVPGALGLLTLATGRGGVVFFGAEGDGGISPSSPFRRMRRAERASVEVDSLKEGS